MQEELRSLRADREQDRRAIRALEAQLSGLLRKESQGPASTAPSPPAQAPTSGVEIPKLAVVRLEPSGAQAESGEEEEDSFVFIADGGTGKSPQASGRGAAATTGGPDAAPPLPVHVELATDGAGQADSEADFQAGLAALEAANPSRAVELLERFVRNSPRHRSADNAVLALGEAWLAMEKPGNALQAFERVVRDYPAGDVVPDALLRYGEICLRLGRIAAAQAAFQRLVGDHPASPAASRAQVHLATR